jgi:hypothetical protein
MSLIRAVHLAPNGETLRKNDWGQSYRLTESPPSDDPIEVVRWLNVENSPRYQPKVGTTYCNIYAHDYCTALGAYLPRVWWTGLAIKEQEDGKQPVPKYGVNLVELSANGLFHWLSKWSGEFNWRRVVTLDEVQEAANRRRAVVICARRHFEAHPGHISVVVPEEYPIMASREQGQIVLPVQSQAGAKCSERATGSAWWKGNQFADYGFWVHE